jgi:hypothetical protein
VAQDKIKTFGPTWLTSDQLLDRPLWTMFHCATSTFTYQQRLIHGIALASRSHARQL